MFRAIFSIALTFGLVATVSASSTSSNRSRGGVTSLVVRTTVQPICTVNVISPSEPPSDAVRVTCRNYATAATPLVRTETVRADIATDAVTPSEPMGSSSTPARSGHGQIVDDNDAQPTVVVINF
jgi:hypothetical protein